jgi:CRP/FNR family transcriptional regulator, dissimilatory nitrate respiration regulator
MPQRAQYREAIREQPLFAALDDEQFERVERRMLVQPLEARQLLFQRGEPARHFYVVLEGGVKLALQSRAGDEKIVELLGPGQSFGEALMFLDAPLYPLAAIATEGATVLSVPNAEYRAVIAENPATCLRLLAEFSRRLHGLVREIEELTLASATNRFVRHVLELAGSPAPGVQTAPVTITLPESKQMLASRLAIKPETLSRILRHLNDAGVVTVEGREIHVPDLDRLRAVA